MTLRLWCRFCLFGCLLILLCYPLSAAIVINEVYYDHPGTDTGYEWIELYNNGSENIQLEGARIQAAGTTWADKYTLPAFVLRPGRFLLIGEEYVANAQLIATLRFENGDTATDGVRYLSPDGLYSDTVLYCTPNLNALTNDIGLIGTSFAIDAAPGSSLARFQDGVDSNLCAVDFVAESNPTPGLPNRVNCDYALLHGNLIYDDGIAQINLWIKNNSPITPSIFATISISQNLETIYQANIPPIAGQDSTELNIELICTDQPLLIVLELADDPDTSNNSISLTPGGTVPDGVYINEFLAYPENGNQEWIELYSSGVKATNPKTDYEITDASTGSIRFSLPATAGYYVVCRDTSALLIRYPDCPPQSLVYASSWTYLNNDGDHLVLRAAETVIDSVTYANNEAIRGVSRERYLNSSNEVMWQNCHYSIGGSPGRANSTAAQIELPDIGSISIQGSPCKISLGESIRVTYNLQAASNRISCKIFDLRGEKIRTLADNTLGTNSGVLYWDGRKQDGSLAPRGLYFLLWESQPQSGGKVMRKQLSAVISR